MSQPASTRRASGSSKFLSIHKHHNPGVSAELILISVNPPCWTHAAAIGRVLHAVSGVPGGNR
jgi:hypothetical protein